MGMLSRFYDAREASPLYWLKWWKFRTHSLSRYWNDIHKNIIIHQLPWKRVSRGTMSPRVFDVSIMYLPLLYIKTSLSLAYNVPRYPHRNRGHCYRVINTFLDVFLLQFFSPLIKRTNPFYSIVNKIWKRRWKIISPSFFPLSTVWPYFWLVGM